MTAAVDGFRPDDDEPLTTTLSRLDTTNLVLAATSWPSNADLIGDVHRLGYLRDDDHVLDPTFEKGVWWKQWRPEKMTTQHRAVDGTDFRDLPHPDGTFDAVAYDPPYVCPGGRKTSNIKEMHARYGMAEGGFDDPDFRTPAELQVIINAGLTEMWRLVRPALRKALHPTAPNGVVLVKCKDYIWSGQMWMGTHHTLNHALALGFVLEDRLEHIGEPGPQSQTTQVHARRNLSTLFVLRKLKASPPPPCEAGPWESDGDQEPGTYYNGATERPVVVEAPL